MSLTVKVVGSLADLPEPAWTALAGDVPDTPFVDRPYLAALEHSGSLARNGFASHHLTLWDGDRLVGFVPCYRKRGEDCDVLPDWAAAVAKKNELPYDPTLFVGVPFLRPPGRKLRIAPGVDRAEAVRLLFDTAKQVAADGAETPVIHYYLGTSEELDLLEPLGFHRRPSAHSAWQNRGHDRFDSYVDALVKSRRDMIRNERKRVVTAGFTSRHVRGDEVTEPLLETLWTQHRHTVEKYGRTNDRVTRELFGELCARMGGSVDVLLIEHGTEIVGSALSVLATARPPTTIYTLFWGAREDISFLVFEMLYQQIEHAITHKLDRVEFGGSMDYQVRRGFLPLGYDYSGTWIGDPDLNEAFEVLAAKERAWTPTDVEQKLASSPYKADRVTTAS